MQGKIELISHDLEPKPLCSQEQKGEKASQSQRWRNHMETDSRNDYIFHIKHLVD